MNKETKIEVSLGCTDFLIEEIEALRRKNDLLSAQMGVVNNFFGMIDRLGGKVGSGYSEDYLWQAKKEIKDAKRSAEEKNGAK